MLEVAPSASMALTCSVCSPEVFQDDGMDDATPMLAKVQFSSAIEGCHSTRTVPSSLAESAAVARSKTTSSSSKCQVPFSSGKASCPPVKSVIGEMVGGMFNTSTSLLMTVVSPSSSIATAVTLSGPSNMGVKVQVG